MSKTPQHEFPEDWRKISNEEALGHIKYLLEHYKEYDICRFGKNSISINGIWICPINIQDHKMFLVNHQSVYVRHLDIYPLIQQLLDVCIKEADKREQQSEKQAAIKAKKADRKGTIINIVGCCLVVVVLVAGTYAITKLVNTAKQEHAKQIKIENEMKRYEKTLPYYDKYLQTKQDLKNHRDSLEKVYQ